MFWRWRSHFFYTCLPSFILVIVHHFEEERRKITAKQFQVITDEMNDSLSRPGLSHFCVRDLSYTVSDRLFSWSWTKERKRNVWKAGVYSINNLLLVVYGFWPTTFKILHELKPNEFISEEKKFYASFGIFAWKIF